jgi:invasion protein IalB
MSSSRGRRARAAAGSRGAVPALRVVLAGALILGVSMAGGGITAWSQETGTPPAAPAAPAAPAQPTPGPRDGQVVQDWTLRCQMAEADREVCEMRQRIVDQNGNRVVLAVVGRLPGTDIPGLLVLLPLGIPLPPGAFLKIDQGEEKRVPIERCEREGCRVELLVDDQLLPRLKAGSKAVVSFHVYDGQGKTPRVDVPISLIGFSAALAEVMK